jgi:hypothetical protein
VGIEQAGAAVVVHLMVGGLGTEGWRLGTDADAATLIFQKRVATFD